MSIPDRMSFICLAACLALAGFHATPAKAVGNTAYLSSTGTGTACSLAAPCAFVSSAITAAGVSGEVICLDKSRYGSVTITASVTISCGDGLWEAPAGSVSIDTPAGADVVIEGLVSDSQTASGSTIRFTGQGSLHLRRVRVGNAPGSSSQGVSFAPNGPATLHVSDSTFYNNGGSGILVRPTGSGSANVHVRNVSFERNLHGLFADGSVSSVGINVNITASVAAENQGNGFGAYSTAGAASVTISIKDSQISGNITNGLGAAGVTTSGPGSAVIEIGSSMITANVNGVATGGSGQIRTAGTNQLRLNGANGAFTGNIGVQ